MINASLKVCPICGENVANSDHHVNPRSNGGTNASRNRVRLCKRCHDIVEEIYERTGLEYSSGLVVLIQLEYNFAPQTKPAEPFKPEGERIRRKVIRFRSPRLKPDQSRDNLPPRMCARCGGKYQPTRYSQALCQTCRTKKTTGREVAALARERIEELTRRKELFSRLREGLLDTMSLPELLVETGKKG